MPFSFAQTTQEQTPSSATIGRRLFDAIFAAEQKMQDL